MNLSTEIEEIHYDPPLILQVHNYMIKYCMFRHKGINIHAIKKIVFTLIKLEIIGRYGRG